LFEANTLALTGIIYLPLNLGTGTLGPGNFLVGFVLLIVQMPVVLAIGVVRKREVRSKQATTKKN
jgi:hypothetical protein